MQEVLTAACHISAEDTRFMQAVDVQVTKFV